MLLKRVCLIIVVLTVLGSASAWACPMCKAFVADAPGAQNHVQLAQGFFWSIMTMLAMPFVLVGSIGAMLYRTHKRRGLRTGGGGLGAER